MITDEISSAAAIATVTAVSVRTSGPADIGLLLRSRAAGRQVAAGRFPPGRARAPGRPGRSPAGCRAAPDPTRSGRDGGGSGILTGCRTRGGTSHGADRATARQPLRARLRAGRWGDGPGLAGL